MQFPKHVQSGSSRSALGRSRGLSPCNYPRATVTVAAAVAAACRCRSREPMSSSTVVEAKQSDGPKTIFGLSSDAKDGGPYEWQWHHAWSKVTKNPNDRMN